MKFCGHENYNNEGPSVHEIHKYYIYANTYITYVGTLFPFPVLCNICAYVMRERVKKMLSNYFFSSFICIFIFLKIEKIEINTKIAFEKTFLISISFPRK